MSKENFQPKSKQFSDPKNVKEFLEKYRGTLSDESAVKVWDQITARQEAAKQRDRYR